MHWWRKVKGMKGFNCWGYNQGKCSWIKYGSINFFSSIAARIEGYRLAAGLADTRWSEVWLPCRCKLLRLSRSSIIASHSKERTYSLYPQESPHHSWNGKVVAYLCRTDWKESWASFAKAYHIGYLPSWGSRQRTKLTLAPLHRHPSKGSQQFPHQLYQWRAFRTDRDIIASSDSRESLRPKAWLRPRHSI